MLLACLGQPQAHRQQKPDWSLAPGEDDDDLQLHAVPFLRCSEHASSSMQSSNLEQQGTTPPRCMNTQQQAARTSQRSIKKPCLSGRRVPGTPLSRPGQAPNLPEPPLNNGPSTPSIGTCPMSDMNMPDRLPSDRNMSDMHHEHLVTAMHGYKKGTCPEAV